MISTTIEGKRIQQKYKQKSLRVKWKLTKSIFNLKPFVTVSILKSKSTANKDLARSAKQRLCSIYYCIVSVIICIKLQVKLSAV